MKFLTKLPDILNAIFAINVVVLFSVLTIMFLFYPYELGEKFRLISEGYLNFKK